MSIAKIGFLTPKKDYLFNGTKISAYLSGKNAKDLTPDEQQIHNSTRWYITNALQIGEFKNPDEHRIGVYELKFYDMYGNLVVVYIGQGGQEKGDNGKCRSQAPLPKRVSTHLSNILKNGRGGKRALFYAVIHEHTIYAEKHNGKCRLESACLSGDPSEASENKFIEEARSKYLGTTVIVTNRLTDNEKYQKQLSFAHS